MKNTTLNWDIDYHPNILQDATGTSFHCSLRQDRISDIVHTPCTVHSTRGGLFRYNDCMLTLDHQTENQMSCVSVLELAFWQDHVPYVYSALWNKV